MEKVKRNLILITGIPGTGKTYIGDFFANKRGYIHYDLEQNDTLYDLLSSPNLFIERLLKNKRDTVITWGFVPDNQQQIRIVNHLKSIGFKLIWFDGNRPAALREFIRRGTVPEAAFYLQMLKIEQLKIINNINPLIINTFDEYGKFRRPEDILEEIQNS